MPVVCGTSRKPNLKLPNRCAVRDVSSVRFDGCTLRVEPEREAEGRREERKKARKKWVREESRTPEAHVAAAVLTRHPFTSGGRAHPSPRYPGGLGHFLSLLATPM